MTEDKRPVDPDDEGDAAGALPDWLREEPANGREFEIPDWLGDPEDEAESSVEVTPPEVAVPRVSPAWVTRDIDVDSDLPATPAATDNTTHPRWLSAPLIALAALIVIAAVLFVALVVW